MINLNALHLPPKGFSKRIKDQISDAKKKEHPLVDRFQEWLYLDAKPFLNESVLQKDGETKDRTEREGSGLLNLLSRAQTLGVEGAQLQESGQVFQRERGALICRITDGPLRDLVIIVTLQGVHLSLSLKSERQELIEPLRRAQKRILKSLSHLPYQCSMDVTHGDQSSR